MFGRRRKNRGSDVTAADAAIDEVDTTADDSAPTPPEEGPYDIDEVGEEAATASRLDLGSVLLPIPPGGQIQVEMAPNGAPQNVHLVTQHGRITVSAYAAPKSPGQWREVAGELAESLRNDKATVSIEEGPWGRELHGKTANADLRFIGVDGYRWMLRCVVAAPSGNADAGSELVAVARSVVAQTVVRRGSDPHPVRTPLPVVLPAVLAQQLAAAQQQQLAARQQAAQAGQAAPAGQPQGAPAPAQPQQQTPPRRGESGSAMQQLGF
ncbi:DUF3710 domain-containing protein [Rhodococcus sp. Z13]|uniref:DUF3710 domain-containing protein n=1 Tax=Rhodococcus sacchari TaxID=2962047 RepID=A0ACD4DLS2_9NOCA|nr:DUF3710 domain-containing protein [Rhodococcus sp. Z13]UYP20653.1 DUF3710 domain-containing protein [Rhodococcus sp. Z13]